jgi:hypothetical protein
LELGARPFAEAVLDDLVVDALLPEGSLDPPARVDVGVQERPGAAVKLDGGDGADLSARSATVPAGAPLDWRQPMPPPSQRRARTDPLGAVPRYGAERS